MADAGANNELSNCGNRPAVNCHSAADPISDIRRRDVASEKLIFHAATEQVISEVVSTVLRQFPSPRTHVIHLDMWESAA
jgi:hypothetical protein